MSEAGSLPPIFSKGRHLATSFMSDKFHRANAKFFLHYIKIITRYGVIINTTQYTIQTHAPPHVEDLVKNKDTMEPTIELVCLHRAA